MNEYITPTELKAQGWTDRLIDQHLGQPDATAPNPHYKTAGAPMRLYLRIGYGTSAGAPGTDQRGVPRPQGAAVDIGAVEVVATSPVITGAAMLTGSGFDLNAVFDATNSYRVQGSTNLRNWNDLTNYVGGGSHSFVDTTATNLNRRFYRTSIP